MGISLVAHIPDQYVVRCVKDVVQGNGQFDYPQARAQMATGLGHGINCLGPKLVGQLPQLILRQGARIGRMVSSRGVILLGTSYSAILEIS